MALVQMSAWQDAPGQLPQGSRVYAVGDVHGRLDLLLLLLRSIGDEIAATPAVSNSLVFLGDYVDRGPSSCGVLTSLSSLDVPGADVIFLKGNHEEFFLDFIASPRSALAWLACGGTETIKSYGAAVPKMASLLSDTASATAFSERVPCSHRRFLSGLSDWHRIGDYFFVHAGIRPGVPFSQQSGQDMRWIRDPFLASHADYGVIIVHGHSVTQQVEIRHNRIGIDTGAYASDVLTCLTLEGCRLRVIATVAG